MHIWLDSSWSCLCLILIFLTVFHSCLSSSHVHVGLRRQRYVIGTSPDIEGYEDWTSKRSSPVEFGHKNLKGTPGQGYCLEIAIGTPGQKFNVLVDTGSSNFAVAASPHADIKSYFHPERSSTLRWLNTQVYVPYTQGRWSGSLVSDLVSMSFLPNKTSRSNIALIQSSFDFFIKTADWQGILGMAYSHLTRPHSGIETFFDSLVRQWKVKNMFALQLCGTTKNNATGYSGSPNMDGSMTVGGTDSSLYKGSLLYVPLRKEWYYEVVIMDIRIDGSSLGMDCKEYNFDKTIVDSGTTDIRLPKRVFNKIVATLLRLVAGVGERFYRGQTLLCLAEKTGPWGRFPSISFSLLHSNSSQIDLHLSPQQYLRYIGEIFDIPGKDCYKFGFQDSSKGAILGAVFMEGFYVVFDRQNRRIGFAQSACNNFDNKVVSSNVTGPRAYLGSEFSLSAWDCAFFHPEGSDDFLLIAAYVLAGLCVLCVIPVLSLLFYRLYRKKRSSKASEKSKLLAKQ